MKDLPILYLAGLIFATCLAGCDNFPKSVDFDVLVWNIWHGGYDESLPADGKPSVVDVIKESGADVVLMIETYGSAPYISEQTGMDYELLSSNLCIFSSYPIVKKYTYPEYISTFNFGGVEILVKDSIPVLFFDTWLHYLPDTRLAPVDAGEEAILEWENEGTRDDEIFSIMEAIKPLIINTDQVPIILGGDLNSHSHLDWIEETKDMYNHGGAVVNWTVSSTLYKNGFRDAFREIHPDPVINPGKTWISGWENDKHVYSKVDRIDYCYYQGTSLKPVASESYTAIPGDTLVYKGKKLMYPSDHGFVITRFRMDLEN
jgi:hypothetical protein